MKAWMEALGWPEKLVGALVAIGTLFALIPKLVRIMLSFYQGAKFTIEIRDHLSEMRREIMGAIGRLNEGQMNLIVVRQQMLDTAEALWFTTDGKGHYEWVNLTYRRLTGLEYSEVRGHGWENGVHPEDRPRVIMGWQTAIDHQRDYEDTYRMIDRNGKATAVHIMARPIRRDDGTILNYVGHSTTEEKATLLAAANPR